uniref:Uncharacterized protein n=1 Tax=viral metagenome TaxID=1070528 RepID=A0A6C0AD53_9ZZZZ
MYILEVLKFNPEIHQTNPEWSGKAEHIGYINLVFCSKKEAGLYYDQHNSPRMRSLNANGEWRSDWDPDTFLMYIVRKHYGYECKKIRPF